MRSPCLVAPVPAFAGPSPSLATCLARSRVLVGGRSGLHLQTLKAAQAGGDGRGL